MANETRVDIRNLGNISAFRTRQESVCLQTFGLETVKKCCYRFAEQHYSQLSVNGEHALVEFRFPTTVSEAQEENTIRAFHRDLVDQDLRVTVAAETEGVRNLILANAFANTDLIDKDDG